MADERERPVYPRPLRGHIAGELIRLLADGAHTHEQLAEQYGVVRQAITAFAGRNADAISAAMADANAAMAGLWIAQKRARVAEYQEDVEGINDAIGGQFDGDIAPLFRHKHNALRSVAEELGDLRQFVSVDSKQVTYTVEGIDPGALR